MSNLKSYQELSDIHKSISELFLYKGPWGNVEGGAKLKKMSSTSAHSGFGAGKMSKMDPFLSKIKANIISPKNWTLPWNPDVNVKDPKQMQAMGRQIVNTTGSMIGKMGLKKFNLPKKITPAPKKTFQSVEQSPLETSITYVRPKPSTTSIPYKRQFPKSDVEREIREISPKGKPIEDPFIHKLRKQMKREHLSSLKYKDKLHQRPKLETVSKEGKKEDPFEFERTLKEMWRKDPDWDLPPPKK